MTDQLTSNAEALRLFFTEDVYLVKDEQQNEPQVKVNIIVESLPAIAIISEQNVVEHPIVASIPAVSLPEKKIEFAYLGKNQKGILILVNDKVNKVSSPQGTELLRKLVKAIELTNNDFALVNYADYPGTSFEILKQYFNCQLLLSFGVDAAQLTLASQPLNQLAEQHQVRLVFTANLHELDRDQTAKKMLWGTLQKLK
jgi:hypothetical protein